MIELSQEPFSKMVVIRSKDSASSQAIALTPDEIAELCDLLNSTEILGIDDPQANEAALRLRQLTIYNGHNLPTMTDRRKYEADNNVGPRFDLEIKGRPIDD